MIWKGHGAAAWQKEAGREGLGDFFSSWWVAEAGEVGRFGGHSGYSFPATRGPKAWLCTRSLGESLKTRLLSSTSAIPK